MSKRVPRPVVFVCIGENCEKPGEFISREIRADSQNEASNLFFEQTKTKAKTIHGPYRPKRMQVLTNSCIMKFADQPSRQLIYDGCEVNVFFLKEPENHAYVVFLKRIDGKKISLPRGTVIVPVSSLRISSDE